MLANQDQKPAQQSIQTRRFLSLCHLVRGSIARLPSKSAGTFSASSGAQPRCAAGGGGAPAPLSLPVPAGLRLCLLALVSPGAELSEHCPALLHTVGLNGTASSTNRFHL